MTPHASATAHSTTTTDAAGDGEIRLLDLAALDATPLQRDPYDWVVVPEFLRPEAFDAVLADFPKLEDPRNHPVASLQYGPAFAQLLDELRSPQAAAHFSRKFGVELGACGADLTVRGQCEASDGNIHPDHRSKVVTALVYLNREWSSPEGMLRILRSRTDLTDYVAEVPPLCGTLLAFKRCDHSFHGHTSFVGERRMVQMSWIQSTALARVRQRIDRLATHAAKRLTGWSPGSR